MILLIFFLLLLLLCFFRLHKVPIAASTIRTINVDAAIQTPRIRGARSSIATTVVGRRKHDRWPFDSGYNRVTVARLR